MLPSVHDHRAEIDALCERFDVAQLELFGSAATDAFDPSRSDLDFLVTFEGSEDLFDRYFGLREGLERIFGRAVDLVMTGAIRNPHFAAEVERTRILIQPCDPLADHLKGASD